jgi:hypothetical protein
MRMLPLVLLLFPLFLPAAAGAQGVSPPSRFDASVSFGGYGSDHDEPIREECWTHDVAAEVTGGFYWSDHLKTEIAFAWTGQSRTSGYEIVTEGPSFYPIYFSHRYRHQTASIAQTYQFGRNAFFHPFVQAGALVDRQRHTIDRPGQVAYLSPGRTSNVLPFQQTNVRVRARAFAGGGFKAYMSERAFFRTNVAFGIRGGLRHVGWTLGVGTDF